MLSQILTGTDDPGAASISSEPPLNKTLIPSNSGHQLQWTLTPGHCESDKSQGKSPSGPPPGISQPTWPVHPSNGATAFHSQRQGPQAVNRPGVARSSSQASRKREPPLGHQPSPPPSPPQHNLPLTTTTTTTPPVPAPKTTMASATPQQQQKDAKAADQPPVAAAAAEQQKSAAALEEDDEFEDFPVEGMRSLLSFPPLPPHVPGQDD